ncbi:MAG TPA: DAK2 domain-containing protein [Streptomyces sp.]|nr:DAK2 domain-containing protein [Streptomyces sp.]
MPHPLDPAAVRDWCARGRAALGAGRARIDAINVFPVADGDTGTNLSRTADEAFAAVDGRDFATTGQALHAAARGALLGACGNSGTILAQLLRGMAEAYTEEPALDDAEALRCALRRAADSAYTAVARPVEGTMLTVARAAADAAAEQAGEDGAAVACAARDGARAALAATPRRLEVLARAGVVDAGGSGLVAVLEALAGVLGGAGQPAAPDRPAPSPGSGTPAVDAPAPDGPAFEVMYLLDADDAAVAGLRRELDALGDSLVVVGGDGLWNVHVHTDAAGAAVEAGIAAGRPHRIRISHLDVACTVTAPAPAPHGRRARAVLAVVHGEGLAGLCAEAGAAVVRVGAALDQEELNAAVRDAGADEVVVLPNDPDLHAAAARAAEHARQAGVRVAVIPTRAAVQGIAALAVHQPDLRFDEDVVAMTSAAGATRHGEVTVAEHRSWTTAGICEAGDVLGMVEGDVAVIGKDVTRTAADVLDRMLSAGGEMVTLVLGADAPEGLAAHLEDHVRRHHLAVDTVVYAGHRQPEPLLIGVE